MLKYFSLIIISIAALSPGMLYAQNANVAGETVVSPEPPARSTVRGRVFYADSGRAVRRASVVLMSEDTSNATAELVGVTDGTGIFQIKNVKAGTYYAMVNAPGVVSPLSYADLSKPGAREKESFDAAFAYFEKIIVNGLTDVEVQVPAIRGGAIGGTVTYDDGDPAIGVRVELFRKVETNYVPVVSNLSSMSTLMGGGGQTDDRGVYRFPGLPPGEYRVKVTENAVHAETEERNYLTAFNAMFGTQSFLSIYYPDVFDAKQSQPVSVPPGGEVSGINIVIPGRNIYRISGKVVTGKDRTPVRGAMVKIKRSVESEKSLFQQLDVLDRGIKTDAEGNWSFKELPKGEYRIMVQPPGEDFMSENEIDAMISNTNTVRRPKTPPARKFANKSQAVTVEDKDINDVIVEMGYGATVSGMVVTEGSSAMPASIAVSVANPGNAYNGSDRVGGPQEFPAAKTQKPDRDFKLDSLPAGKTYFKVTIYDDEFYLKSMTLDGKDLLAGPVELHEGDDLRNIKIVVAKATGILKGKIIGEDREPIVNGKFILVPADRLKRENGSFDRQVTASEKGEFDILVGPGEYAIVFVATPEPQDTPQSDDPPEAADNLIKNAQRVTIKDNETTTVSIKSPKK